MMNYEKKILNNLIDKYEKSKSFTGKNKVSQNFSIKLEKDFPNYADDAEYEIFTQINEAVQNLLNKSFVSVTRKKNGVFNIVSLNTEKNDIIML